MIDDEKKFETLVLTEDDFKEELFIKVGEAIKLLVQARYECQVIEEAPGIIVINYNYDNSTNYGTPHLHWLTEEEEEALESFKDFEEDCETSLEETLKNFKLSSDEAPQVTLGDLAF